MQILMENIKEYLPYILDALVIILPLVSVAVGLAKGFTGLVLPFALTVGFIIIARLYAHPIAQALTSEYFHDEAVKHLAAHLSEKLSRGTLTLKGALPEAFSGLIGSPGLGSDYLLSADAIPALSEKLVTAAEPAVIIPAVTVCVYICFYFAAKVFSAFLLKPAKAIAKLPLIKQADKFLGLIAGTVLGALRLFVYAAAVAVAISLASESSFSRAVTETQLLSVIANEVINIF